MTIDSSLSPHHSSLRPYHSSLITPLSSLRPIGIFWDQSLVWGLLCVEMLRRAGIPFRLLSASDIHAGGLDDFQVLMVPGGWAAHKVRALGEAGKRRISAFIEEGGSYIGFCGGAGMALSSPPALYLVPIQRMPLAERLPSASGRINVCAPSSHPAWEDLPREIPVSVWWPSQFKTSENYPRVCPLAVYSTPLPDFQVADLRISDVDPDVSWPDLEKTYGINLDPAKIKGHPAIIEVKKGSGRMVLSYAHLETPGDDLGNRLLCNLLAYLEEESTRAGKKAGACGPPPDAGLPGKSEWAAILRAKEAAADLISFGEANLLWNWRKPWLLNWRRGVRGLECGTLYVTLSYMADIGKTRPGTSPGSGGNWGERAERLEKETVEFCSLVKRLLLEEKIATQAGTVRKLGKVNQRVDSLRTALFGDRMNHGGSCRVLFDQLDGMLLELLRQGPPRQFDR